MARTGLTGPKLQPTAAAGSTRAQPLLRTSEDSTAFTAEIGEISANEVNDPPDSVILLPPEYTQELYSDPLDIDSPDASWRKSWLVQRCWKTTLAYEQLTGDSSTSTSSSSSSSGTQPHPRLAAYIGRDPWTSLPILAKPSGPPLDRFLSQNKAVLYEQRSSTGGGGHRIKTTFLPLAYKWALHLISALEFVHAQDIILGDLSTAHCWLSGTGSHALSLFLVGFLDASFRDKNTGTKYLGDATSSEPFHPLNVRQPGVRRSPEPSMQTDLFLWGCVVYEIMVGHWPGYEGSEGAKRSWANMAAMIPRQEWPGLEREYLGDLVTRCWKGEVESSRRLQEDLVEFLQTEGWQVEDGDDLQFDASPLLPQFTIRFGLW